MGVYTAGAERRIDARGVTLVELLIGITIVVVLITLAAPGLSDMLDKRRIEGPAESLYADMQFAKSEALKRGRPVRIVFKTAGGGATWCYGLTHSATCDCTVTDKNNARYCYLDINGNNQPAEIDAIEPVRINSNVNWPDVIMQGVTYTGGILTFNPPYATSNAGNIEYRSDHGKLMRVVTAGIGRIRLCSPAGTGRMWGYKAC